MSLTKIDRDEIRAMLHEQSEQQKQLSAATMQPILDKLDNILEQTTKTNGTVRQHGERLSGLEYKLPHTIDACPQRATIQELRDSMITGKSIKRLMITTVTITGVIVGVVVSILNALGL